LLPKTPKPRQYLISYSTAACFSSPLLVFSSEKLRNDAVKILGKHHSFQNNVEVVHKSSVVEACTLLSALVTQVEDSNQAHFHT